MGRTAAFPSYDGPLYFNFFYTHASALSSTFLPHINTHAWVVWSQWLLLDNRFSIHLPVSAWQLLRDVMNSVKINTKSSTRIQHPRHIPRDTSFHVNVLPCLYNSQGLVCLGSAVMMYNKRHIKPSCTSCLKNSLTSFGIVCYLRSRSCLEGEKWVCHCLLGSWPQLVIIRQQFVN